MLGKRCNVDKVLKGVETRPGVKTRRICDFVSIQEIGQVRLVYGTKGPSDAVLTK
jgi:hypothetical protein